MSLRVVIAEDDWLLAVALRSQVEHCGCEVVRTVGTGTQAVQACRAACPDLVFMDVQMPEQDGLSATREIMAQCPTCVVVLTGLSGLGSEVERAGGMLYLTKPLLSQQIPSAMEAARQRFQRFLEVRAQAASPEEACATWQAVRHVTDLLVGRDCISEQEAFAHLQQRAQTDGSSLAAAAEGVAAELVRGPRIRPPAPPSS